MENKEENSCINRCAEVVAEAEVFDYGPQITGIKMQFSEPPVEKTIVPEKFRVIRNGKTIKITGVERGKESIILKLEHGINRNENALYIWDEDRFSYIKNTGICTLEYPGKIKGSDGDTLFQGRVSVEGIRIKEYEKFGSGAGYGLKYRDYKPATDGRLHPLIIWLHGAGEGGMDNSMQILGNRGGVAFVEDEGQRIFDNPYVLAPQCPTFWLRSFRLGDRVFSGERDYTSDLVKLIENYIAENPDIDGNRVYAGGCSMGGYQTFKILEHSPELFAAAFITCPAQEPSSYELDRVKEIPIWLVHSSKDKTVSVSTSRNSYTYLKEHGCRVQYTEYEDVIYDGNRYDPHGSYFYTLHNAPVNSDGVHIFQWVASKSKK